MRSGMLLSLMMSRAIAAPSNSWIGTQRGLEYQDHDVPGNGLPDPANPKSVRGLAINCRHVAIAFSICSRQVPASKS